MRVKITRHKIIISVIFLILITLFLHFQNNSITITQEILEFDNLPHSFNGYRILQISDLHNKEFGKNQERLVGLIRDQQPDLIVITGDIVDSRKYQEDGAIQLIEGIRDIAPIYYVIGNHEVRSGKLDSLLPKLEGLNVKVLRNSNDVVTIKDESIYIVGIDDPSLGYSYSEGKKTTDNLNQGLRGVAENGFTILLAHRPEFLHNYSTADIPLVFTGHTHGGQVRLPLIGGLVAPGQGLFPKYTAGVHKEGDTLMLISRGLGNSIVPQRLFNRPEIVIVDLRSK